MSTKVHVKTTINGEEVEFLCEPRQSLLECLRDIDGLTGSKEGCNDGNCGACTVNLDGRIVDSCLVFGVEVDGKEINTIEGVAYKDELHPIQKAFLENAASEQGSRMTAMDNATRNAGDLVDKLTITYNRSRQAAITKELIEIISGAESL